MSNVLATITTTEFPLGIPVERIEKIESGLVWVRHRMDGGWSRCYKYPTSSLRVVALVRS